MLEIHARDLVYNPVAAGQGTHQITGIIVQAEVHESAALRCPYKAARIPAALDRQWKEHVVEIDPGIRFFSHQDARFPSPNLKAHQVQARLFTIFELSG